MTSAVTDRRRVQPLVVVMCAAVLTAAALVGHAAQGGTNSSTTVKRGAPFTPLETTRIKPIDRASATPPQRDLLGTGQGEGPVQVRLCLYNVEVCRAYWEMTTQLTTRNITIPIRDHEILVLRTAWLDRSATIWSNHINVVSKRAGLDDDESRARIVRGAEAPGWNDWERTLIRAADELHTGRFITDATWKALAQKYNEGQLIELVMTVGHYSTINGYFNTVGIQPDPPVHPMPPDP